MLTRFEGPDGERVLIDVLADFALLEHNKAFAERLAKAGRLVSFAEGQKMVSQGAGDNDLYFILAGEAEVLVNNRSVAIRKTGDAVGEMAILDPTAPRSATIAAKSEVVALKVSESDFHKIAQEFPEVWRVIARIVSDRLRQVSVFLSLPNPNPVLFIGCSTESLLVAQEIQLGLKHDKVEVAVWTDGVFGPSSGTIDALLDAVNGSDFAAFVFSPDDRVTSRDEIYNAPRDNTVFELGLFMGRLERKRTFIVKDSKSDVKIPTDLLGITPITYVLPSSGDLTRAVAPVCHELRKIIRELGVR